MSKHIHEAMMLGEAIACLRQYEDPSGQVTSGMTSGAASAFDMHDAVHILFDCGTSLEGEIAAHVWMKFGTTASLAEMHRAVAVNEHRNVLAGIGHGKIALTWLRMLPRIVSIVARAFRMTNRIAFDEIDALKARSIESIRAQHGIRVEATI